MDKVTQINIEGHNYGFVAGQAVKGTSSAAASDYTKVVVLPQGAELVEGMLVVVHFTNGNTAGFSGVRKAYSSDGITFYWDVGETDLITLPPPSCYTMTHVSGNEYDYRAFPVISVNGIVKPVCDSKGYPSGGYLWTVGDTVTFVYMEEGFYAVSTMLEEYTVNKMVLSASQSLLVANDTRVVVAASGVTATLDYGAVGGVIVDIFAVEACTVTYYTAQGTTASLSMASGSRAVFIYYSGWKLHSNYGTTNQVTVDNMQSVSSNAVANAINTAKSGTVIACASQVIDASGTITYGMNTSVLGAYGYGLFQILLPTPSGYHREYVLSFQGSTLDGQYIRVRLNNIATSWVNTWSADAFRTIGYSARFRETDIVLEPTHYYTSQNGTNLYYESSGGNASSQGRVWNVTITCFVVKD